MLRAHLQVPACLPACLLTRCSASPLQVIYHGPAEAAVQYFVGLGYRCPRYTNPADYLFMDVLNAGVISDRMMSHHLMALAEAL